MTNSLTTWERPRFELGGSNAMVFYVLYGEFPINLTVSASAYRTAGLPEDVELRKLSRAQRPVFPFTDGDFAKTAGAENPGLFAKLQTVPECSILQGQVADPKDLNYLRDAIGLATWFLDHGGGAIMDVQQLRLFDPTAWKSNFFEPARPVLLKHVVILHSKEPDVCGSTCVVDAICTWWDVGVNLGGRLQRLVILAEHVQVTQPYPHGRQAFIPALDDLAGPQHEGKRLIPIHRAVELGAVRQPSGVMDGDGLAVLG